MARGTQEHFTFYILPELSEWTIVIHVTCSFRLVSFNTAQNLVSPESPCIMCVQYIGGFSVHRGVFSTSGGYHEYIGGIP